MKKIIVLLSVFVIIFGFAGLAAAEGFENEDQSTFDPQTTIREDIKESDSTYHLPDSGKLQAAHDPISMSNETYSSTEIVVKDANDTDSPGVYVVESEINSTELTVEHRSKESEKEEILDIVPANEETDDLICDGLSVYAFDQFGTEAGQVSTNEQTGIFENLHDEITEEATTDEILSLQGDPYFTSGGELYRFYYEPGTGEQNDYFGLGAAAIQAAIDFISIEGKEPDDGLIYVEWYLKPYSGFTVDGSKEHLANLRGIVWNKWEDGSITDPNPTINGNIIVTGVVDGFILYGFDVTGTTTISNVTGTLNLTDLKGNIVIKNVEANGNTKGAGAEIDNSRGGNVTIENSSFDHNTDLGLSVETAGIVTINGISASNNGSNGFEVNNFSRLTMNNAVFSSNTGGYGLYAKSEKVAPVSLFRVISQSNDKDGIYINSAGIVNITDVIADRNGWNGIYIDNKLNDVIRNITILRSTVSYNGKNGLELLTRGAVLLTDVSAIENGYSGALINNAQGVANVTIRSSRAGTYHDYSGNGTVTGSVDSNTAGIYVSTRGVVALSDIRASGNNGSGLYIDNESAASVRAVNVVRVEANGNGHSSYAHYGIYIKSKGAVTLTDVQALDNKRSSIFAGIYIDNRSGTANVTIRSSRAGTTYEASGNNGDGIRILSNGVIAVSDVSAGANTGGGLDLKNNFADLVRNVSITRGSFNDNGSNGVKVITKGAVTIIDVNASGNERGVTIDNRSGIANVIIRASRAWMLQVYSNNTDSEGLEIKSNGVVTVNDVLVEGNKRDGIYISNWEAPAARAVTINRSYFEGNGLPNFGNGVKIESRGAVTLIDVNSRNNGLNGVNIHNQSYKIGDEIRHNALSNITIRSSRAGSYNDYLGNGNHGIVIRTNGAVLMSDFYTADNIYYGIDISNSGLAGSVGALRITVTRVSACDNNGGYGVFLVSRGAVTLTDVNACLNGTSGLFIDNRDGTGNVTIRSSRANNHNYFTENKGGYGIVIYSNGSVIMGNVIASGNDGGGASVGDQGFGQDFVKNVTVTRSEFNNNGTNYNSGLYINASGQVIIDTVTASGNTGHGLNVNFNGGGAGNVIIRGLYNDFSDNGRYGMWIRSLGNVSLLNVIADGNGIEIGYANANIYNAYENVSGSVTVSSGNNFQNSFSNSQSASGLLIYSNGTVTISNTSADGNKGHGLDIVKAGQLTVNNSSRITPASFSRNTGDGLSAAGSIEGHIRVIGNILFNENGQYGARLGNTDYPGKDITVNGATFNNNIGKNLQIDSRGNIYIINVKADGSKTDVGVAIYNYYNENGNIVISGQNSFSKNKLDGLQIWTVGNLNAKGITVDGNERNGIDIYETTSFYRIGNIQLQDINALNNNNYGINIGQSRGTINFINLRSLLNGIGGNEAGVYIGSGSGNVYFSNCVIMGNYGYGIYVRRAPELVTFRNTYYFGNNLSNEGYKNVYYQH